MNRPRAHRSVAVSILREFLAPTPPLPPPTVIAPSTLSPRLNWSFSSRALFGDDDGGQLRDASDDVPVGNASRAETVFRFGATALQFC